MSRDFQSTLSGLNPVPLPVGGGLDERARSDRAMVWQKIEAGHVTPARRRRWAWRPAVFLSILIAVLCLAGATALVASHQSQVADPGPSWHGVEGWGAVYLGAQGTVLYYRAKASATGQQCLVRADADKRLLGTTCASTSQLAASGGQVTVERSGSDYLVAGLLPAGITQARIAGAMVPVSGGFLMTRVRRSPGVFIQVFGPGVRAAAAALGSAARTSVRLGDPRGPTYRLHVTPVLSSGS